MTVTITTAGGTRTLPPGGSLVLGRPRRGAPDDSDEHVVITQSGHISREAVRLEVVDGGVAVRSGQKPPGTVSYRRSESATPEDIDFDDTVVVSHPLFAIIVAAWEDSGTHHVCEIRVAREGELREATDAPWEFHADATLTSPSERWATLDEAPTWAVAAISVAWAGRDGRVPGVETSVKTYNLLRTGVGTVSRRSFEASLGVARTQLRLGERASLDQVRDEILARGWVHERDFDEIDRRWAGGGR